MNVQAHGVSHPGHVRKINEDSHLVASDLGLYVVADGMGGHNAGEVASALVVESIHGFMRRTVDGGDVTWPYGIDARFSFPANRLRTAVKIANRRVFRAAEARGEYTGMGTTVVAALVGDGLVTIVSVGDSRLYWFEAGTLTQVTRDDSWIALVERDGVPAGGVQHPMRHVLTKVIGADEAVEFEVTERAVKAPVRLMLCSDGLYTEATEDGVRAVLAASATAEAAAQGLVDLALQSQAKDNVTALVIDLAP